MNWGCRVGRSPAPRKDFTLHALARIGTTLLLLLGACGGKRGGAGGEAGADMTTSTTTGTGGDPGGPTCLPPTAVDFTGAPASDVPPQWGCPCTRRPGP